MDKAGWCLYVGVRFSDWDLNGSTVQVSVEANPVFHGVILYYVVGIDFDGVMRRKAVDGGSGGGVGIGVGGCGEWGGDSVNFVGVGVYDERVLCLFLPGQH